MSATLFTGERLPDDDALFAVDLARHRAAYEIAREHSLGRRLLDLGCGTGAGVASLARDAAWVVGVDRIAPADASRVRGSDFCRADIDGLPLRAASFDVVASFQVLEHLNDPAPYLDAIGALLVPGGIALLTTPNRALSDGVNPYHVHEYDSAELRALLERHFDRVEILGIGARPAVRAYLEARSTRIRRILRLDPLRLHRLLPREWLERAFALGALLVRQQSRDAAPEVDWSDFPVEPADDATSLDWLAVCGGPGS